ncbi:MAG: hypothetical protein IKW90_05045 [Lachnospiraceae bacterium]|nr:hypothetical protein [Lachnospiraceae bacterium]
MKKANWAIVILILSSIILFFPIPMYGSEDSGAIVYSALTYRIIKWDKYAVFTSTGLGKPEHYNVTSLYFFPDNFKSVEELWNKIELDERLKKEADRIDMPENFNIYIYFDRSKYDSRSGQLIKETIPNYEVMGYTLEDYTTEYHMTYEEKKKIFQMVMDMDFLSYPSEYNPCEGYVTFPNYNLTLGIEYGSIRRTVNCKGIAIIRGIDLSDWDISKEGRDFICLHNAILDILMNSDAWKSLPVENIFMGE